ncbi:hypothetical protein ASC94_12040 [Massilia sp. Root418]|uniref:malonate decarboxylase holo-[acyl-carrier-protein] synthase n=1 Tax=Massilia sp. Root418 TaxID=1736532 RepID=UPI0007009576|nr:malonate decarboxylase holo-[acyl-carrier-protein] synthase [Massilia sp. Root418]KQW93367.1 hypothetical protein ASC94_12040 [Massilia sp. Root418]
MHQYQRHDLVWLTPAGWQAALAADPAREAVFSYWQREQWPAVVRRPEPGSAPASASASSPASAPGRAPDGGPGTASGGGRASGPGNAPGNSAPGGSVAGEVFLGIALPPDAQGVKQRVGLRAALEHVERSAAPLTLKAARDAVPDGWRPGYAELERLSAGLDMRVFGSLAWQALTSLPCLSGTSDIDILFRPLSQQQLHAGLALLSSDGHGLPLDGEIMFPSGQAVSWKEWHAASAAKARVLVKDLAGVHLADREALLATLRSA